MGYLKYVYLTLTISLTVYTQLIIKWQLALQDSVPNNLIGQLQYFMGFLRNPWIVSCIVSILFMAFSWIMTLSELPLSYAYPLYLSSVLVIISILSIFLFGESLPLYRLVGLGLIIVGIVICFGK